MDYRNQASRGMHFFIPPEGLHKLGITMESMGKNVSISLGFFIVLLFFILTALTPTIAGATEAAGSAYVLNIDLPTQVVKDLLVTNTLTEGLTYSPSSFSVSGAAGNPAETIDGPSDGSQLTRITWSFGQVDNSANQDITIRFQPIVADVAANYDGSTLAAGQVTLQFTDSSGQARTASGMINPVKVVEPDLSINMASDRLTPASSGQNSAPGSAQGVDQTYTVSVGHSADSHADAYDSDLFILLPAGTIYSPGSAEIVSAPPGMLDDANPQELKMHFDEIDRSWNKDHMILLKFQATTEDEAAPEASSGEIKVALTWKSAPGDNPGTRSYTTSQSIPIFEYVPSYSLSINSVAEPNPVEAGQSLLYTISYANTGQDEVHAVTIEEIYDQNVTYMSAIPMPDADRENLWTIGDLKAGASGTIKLVVRVNPDSADGTMLKNSVKISCGEYATAEAITETIVKGKTDKLTTKASSNSTNSSLTENENKTASQDILKNNTENATAAMVSINDTKVDLVYINQDNATEITNTTSKSDLAINQSDVLMNPTAEAEDSIAEAGNQSETDGDLLEGAANQNETADKSSETLDEVKALEQVEQNVKNDIYTIVVIPIGNNTMFGPASESLENVTEPANLILITEPKTDSPSQYSGKGDTDINLIMPENSKEQILESDMQETDSIIESQPKSDPNNALAKEPTTTETPYQVDPSQFVADLADDVVDQAGTAEDPSGMESDNKEVDQKDPNTIFDVSTLSFSDGTKVDVVFAESSSGSDTTYVMLHEEGTGLSESSLRTDGSDSIASLVNTTAISESAINQTDHKINQTETTDMIPKIAAIEPNSADNSKNLSNTGAVTVDIAAKPPEQVNPPPESTSVQPESLESSGAEENPPDIADSSADQTIAVAALPDAPATSPGQVEAQPDATPEPPAG